MWLLKILTTPIAQNIIQCGKLALQQQYYLIPDFNKTNNFFENVDRKASRGERVWYKLFGTRTNLIQDAPVQAAVTNNNDADDCVLDNVFLSS